MNVVQFRVEIVRPTLKLSGYWSQSAENLLLGTAITESGLNYLKQLGGGPAVGFYQCEPATYEDLIEYIKRDPKRVSAVLGVSGFNAWPTIDALQWNLRYATMICRMHYWRRPEPLPDEKNAMGLANFHKTYYNSSLGATDVKKSVEHFKIACGD